jgi:hypothetical protein
MSHILDDQFMGMNTLRELADTYYRCSTFIFDCDQLVATNMISRLLFNDPDRWGCSVYMASNVRSLEFHVDSRYTVYPRQHYDMRDELELLFRLKQPVKIKISVHRTKHTFRWNAAALSRALSVNFPAFDRLIHAEHVLSLQVGGKKIMKIKHEEMTVKLWAERILHMMFGWTGGAWWRERVMKGGSFGANWCIVKLSKLLIYELNTLVQKEASGHVEGKPPPSDKGHVGENDAHCIARRPPEMGVEMDKRVRGCASRRIV